LYLFQSSIYPHHIRVLNKYTPEMERSRQALVVLKKSHPKILAGQVFRVFWIFVERLFRLFGLLSKSSKKDTLLKKSVIWRWLFRNPSWGGGTRIQNYAVRRILIVETPNLEFLQFMDRTLRRIKKIWKISIFSVRRASQSWGGRFFLYKSIRENPLKSVVFEVVFDFKTTPRPGKSRFFKNVKRLIKYSP